MSNLPPAAGVDVDQLEDLTPQRHEFVQGILGGKTQTQAYRDAFNVAPDTLASSVTANASRLAADINVRSWLRLLRTQAMARGAVTLDGHLAELDSLKEEARATGNYGAAVKAEELRGKAAGVYLGDESGRLAKVPAIQLIALVREGIGGIEGEQAAQKLAKRLGVALLPKTPLTIEHAPQTDTDEAESA